MVKVENLLAEVLVFQQGWTSAANFQGILIVGDRRALRSIRFEMGNRVRSPSSDKCCQDTGRFAPYVDLYLEMVDKQLTYDALRILDFNVDALAAIGAEMQFLRDLAHAGKIAQGRFIAQKR